MFTNLIESDSHRKEFKRRSSFFLATISAYALILCGAGVASIYAYDAHLEAQNTDLTLLSWVPPVKPVVERERPRNREPRSSGARCSNICSRQARVSTIRSPLGLIAPNGP